jgi:hypothetical protein
MCGKSRFLSCINTRRFAMRALSSAIVVFLMLGAIPAARAQENKLPADALDILTKADSFEVFSLDPNVLEKDRAKKGLEYYNPIGQGKAVKDVPVRKKLIDSLSKGMEGKIEEAKCFNPRHAIRATHDGKTVELVICFECQHLYLYGPGDKGPVNLRVSNMPLETFDHVWKDLGLLKAK